MRPEVLSAQVVDRASRISTHGGFGDAPPQRLDERGLHVFQVAFFDRRRVDAPALGNWRSDIAAGAAAAFARRCSLPPRAGAAGRVSPR